MNGLYVLYVLYANVCLPMNLATLAISLAGWLSSNALIPLVIRLALYYQLYMCIYRYTEY